MKMAEEKKKAVKSKRKTSAQKNKNIEDEVQSLARRYTDEALKTLVEIMEDKDASVSSRVSAAQTILDRGWGKLGTSAAKETGTAEIMNEFLNCLKAK